MFYKALFVQKVTYADRVGYPTELHTPHPIHIGQRLCTRPGMIHGLKRTYH